MMGMYDVEEFGFTRKGEAVKKIILRDGAGNAADFLNYGATMQSLWIADGCGEIKDVCLGYDTISEYENADGCFGGLIGRCANRIANSRFILDGQTYMLSPNHGEHHIHGGYEGFHQKIWNYELLDSAVLFSLSSPDGEEGYPGNLTVNVKYSWAEPGVLCIDYDAAADRHTLINLTNHAYFNLDGHDSGRATDEVLQINAGLVAACGESNIPNGDTISVTDTPLDFREPRAISEGIYTDYLPVRAVGGYDHCYLLDGKGMREIGALAARNSGIAMHVRSDSPAMQLYTGNFISRRSGKNGAVYEQFSGVCLETQYVPNAVNLTGFEKPEFSAGKHFSHRTEFRFVRRTVDT